MRRMISAVSHEMRFALRRLLRRPGLSLAVIVSLALAIGASAAIFSLVDGVLLAPLPYPDSEKIVQLSMISPVFDEPIPQSQGTYLHFEKENHSFDAVALAEARIVTFDDGTQPERLQAAEVTAPIYEVLGIRVASGRPLVREDSLPGAEAVAVLGHDLWATRFGADPEVVGRTLEIDGVSRRVVGLLPQGLAFPSEETQLWLPLTFDPAAPGLLNFRYSGYGRLAAGVDSEAATRDLDRLISTLPEAYPGGFSREVLEQAEIRSRVRPLKEELVGDVRSAFLILLGAVLAIMGITAANLANLFAVRAESRRQELAVMSALGAGKGRSLVNLLGESAWLTTAGCVAGLVLGAAALKALKFLAIGDIPRLHQVGIDARVVVLTVGLAMLVGFLTASAPALERRWGSLAEQLRLGSMEAAALRGLPLRHVLVIVQVALALMLVVGSGLLVRSYWTLSRVDPGFDDEDVLTLRVALQKAEYGEWTDVVDFSHRFVARVRALPGVRHAAVTSYLPLRSGRTLLPYDVDGEERSEKDAVRPMTAVRWVSEDFFTTLGIPLMDGRPLERVDTEGSRDSVVVDQAFAERHWAGESPIGMRIRLGSGETWLNVVGVARSVRDESLVEAPEPLLYLPLMGPAGEYSFALWELSLAVKTDRPAALLGPIRESLAQMNRSLPIFDVTTMDQVVADASARSRFTAMMLVAAALGALALGAVGLYGLLAYIVVRQRREIGIRMALGARASQVRSLVVGRALTLALVGVVLGVAGALSLGRLLASQLYEIRPSDPLTLFAAGGLLLVVSWLAAEIPARRAARVDPVGALRQE